MDSKQSNMEAIFRQLSEQKPGRDDSPGKVDGCCAGRLYERSRVEAQ